MLGFHGINSFDTMKTSTVLTSASIAALVASQPATVLEALRQRYVGRRTTRALLDAGLLNDPEGVQRRSVYDVVGPLGA